MTEHEKPSKFIETGSAVSAWASNISAHPFAQIGLILFCAAWFLVGLRVDILTAGLSILAITLTQMVLNRQKEREAEAHRRDVAMHAKLDELVIASRHARDEIAGIEEMDEEDIVELKERAQEVRDEAKKAKATVEEAEKLAAKSKKVAKGGRG
jgi:low affinity Fe/Cu permease